MFSDGRSVAACAVLCAAGAAWGQCPPRWFDDSGAVFNGSVLDITEWNGGLAAVGNFTQVNGQACPGVAVWDGLSWAPYGQTQPPFTGTKHCAIAFNQWLVVDGKVHQPPLSWFSLAGGLEFTTVYSMTMYNGELYAAGTWNTNLNSCVWKLSTSPRHWVGVGSLGAAQLSPEATDLQVYNGKLVAVGNFGTVTAGNTPNIAQWNGTSWSGMGTPMFPTRPLNLGAAQGQLFASGAGSFLGYLMSYDGTTWRTEMSGLNSQPISVGEYDGVLMAGLSGRFMIKRNGVWTQSPMYLGSAGVPTMYDMMVHDGALFVGGSFNTIVGQPAGSMGRYFVPNSDFDGDGDYGTDADIQAFFACLGGNCCAACWTGGADFNGDGDIGTDGDIETFFRVLGGGC